MADNIEDGGPAFPTIHGYVDSFGSLKQKSEGLSLRDWFAGQALAALITDDEGPDNFDDFSKEVAESAYGYADAMLAARKAGA